MIKLQILRIGFLLLTILACPPIFLSCNQEGKSGAASSALAEGQGIAWITRYQQALEMARKENKPILLDLYTDWCGWCKKMDAGTFTDPQVIEFSRRMVFLKLNAETEQDGIALQQKFEIASFPTTLVMDSGGEEIDRVPGYLTAEEFVSSVEEILKQKDALAELAKREANGSDDLETQYDLGKRYYQKRNYKQAKVRFDRIIVKDREDRSGLVGDAHFYKGLCSAHMNQMDEAIALLRQAHKSYPKSKHAPDAELVHAEILMKTQRTGEARKIFQDFLKKYPEHRMADQVRQLMADL